MRFPSGSLFFAVWKFCMATAHCRIVFWQAARRPASRAAWIAGSSSATRMPMIAITTSSSTSVNARRAPALTTGSLTIVKRDRRRILREFIDFRRVEEKPNRRQPYSLSRSIPNAAQKATRLPAPATLCAESRERRKLKRVFVLATERDDLIIERATRFQPLRRKPPAYIAPPRRNPSPAAP
jgi:hypothetical protein